MKNYFVLHCHTDNSVKDGAQTVKELVNRAKEVGATSVSLTDHGVLTGALEFLDECKKNDIKGILGVEAYMDEGDGTRRHLVLLAKDWQGYKAIERAVSLSYQHVYVSRTKKVIPLMTKENLKECFSEGTKGHGHVFATSACIAGVISSILNYNEHFEKVVKKNEEALNKIKSPESFEYIELKRKLDDLQTKLEQVKEERQNVRKESKRPTKKAENYMHKREGTPEYAEAKDAYDALIASIESAKEKLVQLDQEFSCLNSDIRGIKAKMKSYEKDFDKYQKYTDKINTAKNQMKDDGQLRNEAQVEIEWYKNLFGKDNFFIEIQNHGYPNEAQIMPYLVMLANMTKTKMVCANDAHYAKPEDYIKREMLVTDLLKGQLGDIEYGNTQMYVKSAEELRKAMEDLVLTDDIIDSMFENLDYIAENCNIVVECEKHYPVFNKTPEGMTQKEYLIQLIKEGIKKKYPNGYNNEGVKWDEEHKQRVQYELSVMEKMDVINYHLIVQDYLNFGKSLATKTPEGVGYTIGPGRGSAVGSLICYLLGITALDPIKYDLFFERYLNVERVSMPDIDADFANFIRDDCIEYMRQTYGHDAVAGIMTKSTIAPKSAIQLVGRVLPESDAQYLAKAISDKIPMKNNPSLNGPVSDENPVLWKDYLKEQFTDNTSIKIIDYAATIEGLQVGFGRHAAGIVISDTGDLKEQVALMCNDKNELMIQTDKVQAEDVVGLLKFDFLGLKNLDIITSCLRKIKRNHNIAIDMENDCKFEAEVFENIFSTGNTDAVFQFASIGMKNLLTRFKPNCFEDIILLVAAYRPGPMQYIDDIIDVKQNGKKVRYKIPQLAHILDTTYGKTIYQEQVQAIFKDLAGYSLGDADLVRRAMAKKKLDKLEHEREAFLHGDESRNIKGCVANGINEQDANDLFDELTAFASYAFNKSHAAAYALVSYQTAWLKHHYPAEYMSAVIETSKYEKVPGLLENCRTMGIKVLLPDINESQMGFVEDGNSIRLGFKTMKGVGNKDAEIFLQERDKAQYVSFKSFLKRNDLSIDTIKALINGGAFDSFGESRKGLLAVVDVLQEMCKKYKKESVKIKTLEEEGVEENEKKMITAKQNLELYKNDINNITIPTIIEDDLKKLIAEKKVLGTFISGHPIDSYSIKSNIMKISQLTDGNHNVCGVLSNVEIKTSKKGNTYVRFNMDDGTGTLPCIMFNTLYEKIKDEVVEDGILCLNCKIESKEIESANEDEEKRVVFSAIANNEPEKLQKKQKTIILNVPNCVRWFEMFASIKLEYEQSNGMNFLVYDESLAEVRNPGFKISKNILNDKKFHTAVSDIVK